VINHTNRYGPSRERPYLPLVLMTMEPDTGDRHFVFGWAREVSFEMNREPIDFTCEEYVNPVYTRYTDPQYSTGIEWVGTPQFLEYWPTASDWTNNRELTQRSNPDAELLPPPKEIEA